MVEHQRTRGRMQACGGVAILFALLAAPRSAAAQGSPVKMAIGGAGSHAENGALRCAIGEEAQFSLTATDSAGQTVIFEQWLPEVSSSDEQVLKAELSESSPYVVNTVCKADGEAWILAQSGDAKLEFPVLVGRARSRKTPQSRVAAPPVTTNATPTTATTAITPTTTPTNRATITGRQGQPLAAQPDSAERGVGASVVKAPTPNAPAVAATGLVLYAGYNNVQLTWRPAPGAAGYRVARKDVAANELVTLTGDQVARDGSGLVRDTSFFDGSAVADRQYVYYLATYFQRPNGDYYFPDRNSEARGVATPRSSAGHPWLPADWRDRPQPKAVTVVSNGTLDARWHSKSRVAGYIYFSYVITREDPGNSCSAHPHVIVGLGSSLPGHGQVTIDSSFVKNIPSSTSLVDPPLPGDTRRRGSVDLAGNETLPVTMYCMAIHAVYPEELDATGTPVVVGFDQSVSGTWNADEGYVSKPLWIAVRRSCPSAMTDATCTPWQVVPSANIDQMHQ